MTLCNFGFILPAFDILDFIGIAIPPLPTLPTIPTFDFPPCLLDEF
jgi:hypothetical protein